MRSRKRAAALSASTLLATAVLMGASPAAQAIPDNCSTSQPTASTVASFCAGGTGQHQVAVTVLHVNPAVGYVYNEGLWQPPGTASTASLPPGTIISLRVNRR
ncbi:hypothetical protein [Nonomuraea sp. NPDC046570]|uniref:hypothetical protein n=1 Tax=Nonomuraea sp. NPDC046570 TaxID=3155255 RepID=UPI0033F10AF7